MLAGWRPIPGALAGLAALLMVPAAAPAAPFPPPRTVAAADEDPERLRFAPGEGIRVQVSPANHLYEPYLADIRRPQFGFQVLSVTDSDIPAVKGTRLANSMGGTFGLLRFHPPDAPDRGVQLELGAGFYSHFDAVNGLDAVGWNGLLETLLSWRGSGGTAYRLGFHHVSSHVGDEYIENTGRSRIDYTREEWQLGVSHEFSAHWRGYAEVARGWLDAFEEPWRGQAGLEYRSPLYWGRATLGWFGALDGQLFQEADGDPAITAQTGLYLPVPEQGRLYRLGLEFYRGASPLGEFYGHHDEYAGIGFWIDI